ncbi:MFS transporter [Paraburkholderia atlantica]|uniref:MFS transporter n=1 Tax=Paraburkholderia atlantica TaxID=2654982 RepID=UPI0017E85F45|nr:MFS transporter [Paraburkholderia atlantica]MBB5511178.1 MFS family permease [Paraburkholderia atlantica]
MTVVREIKARINSIGVSLASLLLSDLMRILAEMVGYITLPWWIVHRAGAHDLAIYSVSIAITTIFAMPLLSPLGDRYAKRPQIAWGLCTLMVVAFTLATLASLSDYRLMLIICIGVVTVIAKAFIDPAGSTISAELVSANRLAEALRLRKSTQAAGRAVGPALAGATLALGGIAATFWMNGILLGVAAYVTLHLPSRSQNREHHRGLARWWEDLRAGLHAKWIVPLERGWTLVNFLVWIFQGPAVGMLIPLKVQSLGLSGLWLGVCEAALSIGLLLGSFRGSNALVSRFGRFNVRVGAAMCEGLALAASGWAHSPIVLVLAFTCVGFANASMGLVGATHRSLAIPQNFRVRILAASMMTTQIAGILGPMIAGAALTHWAVGEVYTCFGLATCLLALGFVLIPRSREFFALNHEQVKDWFRHEYPHAFASSAVPESRQTT